MKNVVAMQCTGMLVRLQAEETGLNILATSEGRRFPVSALCSWRGISAPFSTSSASLRQLLFDEGYLTSITSINDIVPGSLKARFQ